MICPECRAEMEPINHNGRGYRCPSCWWYLGDGFTPDDTATELPPDETPQPFDVTGSNVDEVMQAVADGKISAMAAWQIENEGKARKTLLRKLDDLYGV